MQSLINQCLKCNENVDKFERRNYISEIIITNAKRYHLFIILAYFNSMIYILKFEFNKVRNAYKTIQRLIDL